MSHMSMLMPGCDHWDTVWETFSPHIPLCLPSPSTTAESGLNVWYLWPWILQTRGCSFVEAWGVSPGWNSVSQP